ncbi:MAG: LacI family DNA-binding transcriptional regulator [Pseudomonadota bacterium]
MTTEKAAAPAVSTLNQVAVHAGVSPSTVSRFLNGTAQISAVKRDAIEKAISALNYSPNLMARGLASGRSQTIGVITQDITSVIFNETIHGVEDALAELGYSPLFANGHWDSKEVAASIELLIARRVDGIVLMPGWLSDEEIGSYARRVPLVLAGRRCADLSVPSVSIDNYQGAARATQYLLDAGHRDIAFISGPVKNPDSFERMRGYQETLLKAGIAIDQRLMLRGDFNQAGGVIAINQLVESKAHFTAVFAANDLSSYGARLGLFRHGLRVPEDVSLVGFDDLPHSSFCIPPLTTIRQPAYQLGRQAANAVVRLIGSGEVAASERLPLELIVRESVRPLPLPLSF